VRWLPAGLGRICLTQGCPAFHEHFGGRQLETLGVGHIMQPTLDEPQSQCLGIDNGGNAKLTSQHV
jgi:hypothetical protein